MVIQEFTTADDYILWIKSNQEAINKAKNYINAFANQDINPLWRQLLMKKNSELSAEDRNIIDMNPELWWYRQKVNNANKIINILEWRNRQLKREYDSIVKTEMAWELWVSWEDIMWKISDLWDSWSETTTPSVTPETTTWSTTSATWAATSATWATSRQTPYNDAVSTLEWSKKQIMSSADEQLQGAAIASNKESWYLKWLATRTWSSFGEAKLADDRANAVFREQASNIKSQRDTQLAWVDQNIAWVKQWLWSTMAQLENSKAQSIVWSKSSSPKSNLDKILETLAWWWDKKDDPQSETKVLTDEEKMAIQQQAATKKPPVPSSNTWWYNPYTGKVELFWS